MSRKWISAVVMMTIATTLHAGTCEDVASGNVWTYDCDLYSWTSDKRCCGTTSNPYFTASVVKVVDKTGDTPLGIVRIPDTFKYNNLGHIMDFHVHAIKAYAFRDTSIESIQINQQMREIGYCSFMNCQALTSVLFSDSQESLQFKDKAFSGCTSLVEFHFPARTASIGSLMFTGCDALEIITGIDPEKYTYENGILYDKEKTNVVKWLKDAKRVIVHEGVVTLTSLSSSGIAEEIVLPESLQTIAKSGFASNTSMKKITIRRNVANIGDGAFLGTPLQTVVVDFGDTDRVREMIRASLSSLNMNNIEFIEIPANPEIYPTTGSFLEGSTTVTISCASDGAKIYYTTDGTEPTQNSTPYKKFRISGKTVVKAIAVIEGLPTSKVVTAEYALGQCPDPVISTTDGEAFYHKGNQVSIAYDCEEGVVHYTTDGSEPTKESPVYEGPFTTDESMIVKAKAFSDNYFDSAVVTATLTREWETVATPVIAAAESFTGAKTKVEISCATEGATIRYTLNGSDPNSHAKKYTGPFYVTEGCTIKAYAVLDDYTNSEIASKTITKVWGIGDSVALPDQAFTTAGDAEWGDASGEAMKSGAIADNQKSILSTMFVGKGVLSFKWKVSCEEDEEEHNWDHAAFFVDGVEIKRQDGQTDWFDVAHTIETEGSHTVEWAYVKDEAEADGEDCMWVKDIIWMPERTQTSEVKVETSWLKTYFPTLGSYYFDYEEKANETAANGINKVWETYLIGLDPTDSAAKFVSSIAIEDGKPVVSWDPDLGGARAYKVLGSTDLKTWTKVEEGRERDYNFFKVSVEMK